MQFIVTHLGTEMEFTWDQGKLIGDQRALDMLEIRSETTIGPPGGPHWTGRREIYGHLTPFYLLAKRIFDSVKIDGELPPLPEVPAGVVT